MSFVGKAVGSILGTDKQADAAKEAGDNTYAAAKYAADQQMKMFEQMQKNLAPYMTAGQQGMGGLLGMLGMQGGTSGAGGGLGSLLTRQFQFDPSQLESTPGYQFTLNQGLKSLANQNAAKGLGLSGAQQKGALEYATGLANNTYGDQYSRALQSYMTNYGLASDMFNRFSGLAGLGQNAAAGVGNAGMQTASNMGNLLMQGTQAQGSGLIGAANANASALGAGGTLGLAGAGTYSLLSDRRYKADISLIGKTPGGHNWYRYRYKGYPDWHEGVMAQEVEQTVPDAVVEHDGVKYVDYSKVH